MGPLRWSVIALCFRIPQAWPLLFKKSTSHGNPPNLNMFTVLQVKICEVVVIEKVKLKYFLSRVVLSLGGFHNLDDDEKKSGICFPRCLFVIIENFIDRTLWMFDSSFDVVQPNVIQGAACWKITAYFICDHWIFSRNTGSSDFRDWQASRLATVLNPFFNLNAMIANRLAIVVSQGIWL